MRQLFRSGVLNLGYFSLRRFTKSSKGDPIIVKAWYRGISLKKLCKKFGKVPEECKGDEKVENP